MKLLVHSTVILFLGNTTKYIFIEKLKIVLYHYKIKMSPTSHIIKKPKLCELNCENCSKNPHSYCEFTVSKVDREWLH